jgi:SNF2 family DNA or RNA helicase
VLLPRVAELVAEGRKALVFSQFTSLLGLFRERLDAHGIAYQYLDGDTRDRALVVQRFQEDPAFPVFLISLKAGGVGLNLTAAEYVFLLDPWWNPAVEMQAVDRTHRIGQLKPVFAYRLVARGTVEERILELQSRKRELADAILEAGSGGFRALQREDLEQLLS